MITVADAERKVSLPESIQPGAAFHVVPLTNGELLLSPVREDAGDVKIVYENGQLRLWSPRKISWEETRRLMDEFP